MTTHLDWERLGRFVRAARGPRAQADIAANGGPSDETISKIEQGRWRPTRSVQKTLDKLEAGLGWAPGSANSILAGGEPLELQSATTAPNDEPPPHVPLSRQVTDDFIETVGRTREYPPLVRASELLRVVATSVNITRNTLIHDTSSAGRANAIDTLYAATNALPYVRDAIEEMKGDHDGSTMEIAAQSDAQTEGDQGQEAGADDAADAEPARPAGDHHPPSRAETASKPRRRDASEIQNRIPRPAKLGKRGKDTTGFDQ